MLGPVRRIILVEEPTSVGPNQPLEPAKPDIRLRNEAGVPARLTVEKNSIKVTVSGCFEYKVEPLRCPNCYIVKLFPAGRCPKTVIYMPYSSYIRSGSVTLVMEENVREVVGEAAEACYSTAEEIATYGEDLAKEFLVRCREKGLWAAKEFVCKELAEKGISIPLCKGLIKRVEERTEKREKEEKRPEQRSRQHPLA